MRAAFVGVSLIVLLSSCASDSLSPSTGSHESIIYEVEYVNNAWGYAHNGFYVSTAGAVHTYDIARTGQTWKDTSTGYYSAEELYLKFSHRDSLVGYIDRSTLIRVNALVESAKCGTYSDTVCVGADMGARTYNVYSYVPEIQRYQRMTLRLEGDWTFHNTSRSAMDLVEWLNQVISPR